MQEKKGGRRKEERERRLLSPLKACTRGAEFAKDKCKSKKYGNNYS